MFKPPPNPIFRLLTPRVFFYLFLTLMVAWLMHRHGKHLEEAGQKAAASSLFVEPQPATLIFKESDLTSQSASRKPMLLLISNAVHELLEVRQALEMEFCETCSIILLDAGRDKSALDFFRVGKTPVAILFAADNEEVAREENSLQPESLKIWLKEQLLK